MSRVSFFEIPVVDFDQALRFYQDVFQVRLEITVIDGNRMALFPGENGPAAPGAGGALACGQSYRPSLDGTRVYFDTDDIDAVLDRAVAHGGRVLYPKTSIGAQGCVAEFADPEGNRIALGGWCLSRGGHLPGWLSAGGSSGDAGAC